VPQATRETTCPPTRKRSTQRRRRRRKSRGRGEERGDRKNGVWGKGGRCRLVAAAQEC